MKFPFNYQFYIFIVSALLIANPVYANTTIITVRTESAVYIGADSKAVPFPFPKCKIEQAGDIFFAIAGTPAFSIQETIIPLKTKETSIDFYEIIRNVGKEKVSIREKVSRIETILRNDIPTILEAMRNINPDFCTLYPRDKIVITVIIAGLEDNNPVFYVREVRMTTPCDAPVIINVNARNKIEHIDPRTPLTINLAGEFAAILRSQMPISIADDEIASYINKWIILEIIDRPDIVGPPIDILRITNKGAEWIQKNECKEVQ